MSVLAGRRHFGDLGTDWFGAGSLQMPVGEPSSPCWTGPGKWTRRTRDLSVLYWFYLAGAIGCEIVATSALKAADGFKNAGPATIVVIGYVAAFYCLSVALRAIPMGVAYAIWSGIGIVVISLVGLIVYKQRLDAPAIFGILLIIAGTLVINLLSKAGHS
jgi:small multidrug resistance pump